MAHVVLTDHFDQAMNAADAGAEKGLDDALEHLTGAAQRLAPHEEGILELSGTPSRDGLRGAVSFDTPYAVRQHEELDYRHDPGRQAKYLEQPLHSGADERQALIAAAIRRELRS